MKAGDTSWERPLDDPRAEAVGRCVRELAQARERTLLTQLGDLVRSGLLVVVEATPTLVQTDGPDGMSIRVEGAIGLRCAAQDRIDGLTAERDALQARLDAIDAAIRGTKR